MNEHATQVLDAYLDAQTHPVPHAVLIEGRWGAGKTHFLRETYEPARAERAERQGRRHVPFLFVSLFGATSAQDVEMRIFKTACPGEAVAGSIAGTIALGIGEFFQVTETAKGTLKAFGRRAVRRLNEFVFVLDDLERVEPDAIGEVMGLVASMVDEHKRRVILVADEPELRKRFVDYEWDRRAEKVIGRRAEIRPDFADMAAKLVVKLPDGHTRDFLRDRTEQILDVVSMSETRNLRDLAWALHNAASFAECLLEDGDIPADHITRTVQVVVAVSLWSRSGQADRGALENLPELSVLIHMDLFKSHQEEVPERDPRRDVAKEFMERFAALNVESPPIDYATILDFEQGGVMDGEALRLQVKKQFGFGKDHAEPSWRVLWHSRKHTFDETEQALNELAQELTERRYARSGDLLHAIGQAIKFRDAGDARLTNDEEIVPFFKRYIDDLQQADLLDPVPDGMFSEESSDGLGIASTECEEFKTLHHYLRKKRAEAKKAKQRREVDAILQAFALGETDELFRLVRNDDPLSRSPVLSALATDEVADLFARNPISLDAAGKLLAYRYNDLTPKGPLEAELPWARLVVTAIQERVGRWDDPHRSLGLKTFRGIIRHYEQAREPGLQILPEDEERPA